MPGRDICNLRKRIKALYYGEHEQLEHIDQKIASPVKKIGKWTNQIKSFQKLDNEEKEEGI